MSSTHHGSTTQQLQTLESQIQTHLELTKKLTSEVSDRRRQLQADHDDDEEDETQVISAIGEVKEQSQVLEQDEISTGVFHAQVHARVTGQEIGDVMTEEGSSALVGMPKSVVGKINQRIGNVTTRGSSSTVVGVFPDDVNIGSLRSRPS